MRIFEYFRKTAQCFPDKIAFADGKRSITFKELLCEAEKYASTLGCENHGLSAVIVETDRSIDTPVRILGAMAARKCYVPVDVKAPQERKDEIRRQLEASGRVSDIVPEGVSSPACHEAASDFEGLAYILFTSGSTGKPKGVEIEEFSLINFAETFISTMGIDENTIFGNQAPFCFDASMEEFCATIFAGATTHILPKKFFSFPKLFAEYINENKINTLNLSGSALGMIATSGVLEAYPPEHLKLVMAGNETVHASHINIWKRACPGTVFVNAYGPTEATVESSYFFADRELSDDESVPIGKPCKNTEIFLVDDNGDEIKAGGTGANDADGSSGCGTGANDADGSSGADTDAAVKTGEILIAGPGLARGYLGDKDKTDSAFVMFKGRRVYKTGDRAYYDKYGDLVFVGRADNQIKHTGYRVELGDIEAEAAKVPGVSENACIFIEREDKIICFYSGTIEEDGLAAILRTKLAAYMLPSEYCRLYELPHNSNDKIDRRALESKASKER